MQSVAASSADDVSMLVIERDRNCQATDENTGEPCGETEGLRILNDFRKLYESRIEKIDRESGGESDRVSMKLQIMSDWIKDLGEQNAMLVHTVEDLEQTACSRVKLLEEKLKQSQMVVDNLARSNHSEKTLNTLSNRVSQLEKDEEYLQQKIEYLKSDIRGLLEVIRRARRQNIWSLEGITFLEIQPEDIPVSADCVCGQEQVETEYIKSLNLQVEKFQENEKRLTRSHMELEGKIADLTTELLIKDESVKTYISRLQCFCERLKEQAKQTNQVISHPLTVADQDCNIILIPDILESVLDAKDTENKSLRRQLQDIESKLMVHTYEKNIDTNTLRVQLEEKCKRIQELEDKVACLEKETVDTRDTLTTEIATLEKQNYHANIGNLLKDDLIKEMRKGLKQATLEDMPSRKVCIDTSNFPEKCPLSSIDASPSKKDEFISFLNSTKVHVQKECDILSDLKFELGKFVEKLAVKDNEMNECIISNNCTKENKMRASAMSDKLVNCIEIITKMYSEREKEITLFDCMMKKEQNHCACGESRNIKSYFKLMEEYRICTVEVQAATEDIREEISTVLSSFNSRHQNYEELSEVVAAVQSHSVRTREGLVEAINRLELQEEERLRHGERIISSKLKLKDIKNEINQAQSGLSRCINGLQESTQEYKSGNAEGCISNDLLAVIMEEIEQILTNLQLFQTQGNCVTSILKELKGQICTVDCSLKDLQKRTGEVLVNNEIAKTTFCERENRLAKLEEEVDCTHTKMQDVLETLLSTKQEEVLEQSLCCTLDNQEVNDIIKMKEELHKLQKEYNELKLNMIQQTCQMKHEEKLNKWKNRVIDLEDQIRMLQHEVKCKQEANNFFKNSIQSTEKELMAVRKKADCYRQSHSRDSMELKKKITELENIIKTQREVENDLRKNLNNVANMKKSAEISSAFHMEYNTETLLRCDYPSKHENISHLFKIVQDATHSAKLAVQEFESDLKKLIREESSLSSVSAKSVMTLTESLGKCREKLDMCSHELSKLKTAVYSKEKLLENMEEVIRIQRDSLTMSQAEVKDLHQKLQEKIDKQNLVIVQYEREKNELTKQNELQIQTIGHLQNAVVEAKRNLDQMGHKAMSDLCKKDETIRQLAMCIDETQDQYNECFTDVTNQDLLLDLQRDAIDTLHKRIHCLEYDKKLIATTIHTIYYSVLSTIQERIYDHVKDLRELKWKMNSFMETKDISDGKYMSKSCTIYFEDKNCDTQDLEYSSCDIKHETSYMERYSDKEVILSELNTSEYEMLVCLCDRVYSLKSLLQEKSDNMVKLQADYELLKNENAILKKQSDVIEIQTKDDILKLKKLLKETRLKLRETEDNHQRMIENFDKVQEQLKLVIKRETESKESLTVMEKDYCSKIGEIENEAANLRNSMDKLNEELEETKRKLTLKDVELCQTQDTCKSYADHLNTIRQDLEKEKEEVTKAENTNRDLIQQLQDYINENYHLGQQKFSLEQDNSTYVTELQSMRKSLLELRRECHLKDESLTCMSADLTEAAVSRSELCKESQYILSCVRDCLEHQKKYSETLAKTLENKQQLLMQLIFEKKTLLIKMKKLKRINLLAQKLKRTHRQLTSKTIKKHVNGYISPSDIVRQNADASPIPSSNYTDLYKKCFMQPIKTGRRVSTCGDSWWFPKMEHLINQVRKSNQWWNENFSNETESDTSLEESRDYGYQSSSTSK